MTLPSVAEPPLGLKSRFASPPPTDAQERRARRFMLQSVARELLAGEWMSRCMRFIRHDPEGRSRAEVWYSPKVGRSYFRGLFHCASVWGCPVCASKITQRSVEELRKGTANWKGSIFLATFTLQHTREDDLKTLYSDLKAAFRALKSGKAWIGFEARYGLVGSIVGGECTYSLRNGHHPHLHVLFFSNLPADQIDHDQAEEELYRRFASKLEKRGRYVSAIYGVRIEEPVNAQESGNDGLKKYIAKWGLEEELVKSPVKKASRENGEEHYSPFQLLELYAGGKKWAGPVFREYYFAMKGSRRLRYSPGLRELLGLDLEEKNDEELVEEVQHLGDVLLSALSASQWGVIDANDARAELLNVADSGDTYQVNAFLSRLGITGLPGGIFEKGGYASD